MKTKDAIAMDGILVGIAVAINKNFLEILSTLATCDSKTLDAAQAMENMISSSSKLKPVQIKIPSLSFTAQSPKTAQAQFLQFERERISQVLKFGITLQELKQLHSPNENIGGHRMMRSFSKKLRAINPCPDSGVGLNCNRRQAMSGTITIKRQNSSPPQRKSLMYIVSVSRR